MRVCRLQPCSRTSRIVVKRIVETSPEIAAKCAAPDAGRPWAFSDLCPSRARLGSIYFSARVITRSRTRAGRCRDRCLESHYTQVAQSCRLISLLIYGTLPGFTCGHDGGGWCLLLNRSTFRVALPLSHPAAQRRRSAATLPAMDSIAATASCTRWLPCDHAHDALDDFGMHATIHVVPAQQ